MADYAAKLTATPAEIGPEDLAPLRAVGLSDRDILDLNQVACYFAYANRMALGLGLELEDHYR